jgi:peptidoglycan/LPS O-acetylase OafA/YrhL
MNAARNANLDLVRGIAALAVCGGHLRAFIFVDWGDLHQKNALNAIFYLLTGYSHPAVVAFFVLSGYLVGGSTYRLWKEGRWSWTTFLVQRMVRLHIVLIPALLMTAFLDTLGIKVSEGLGYDGAFNKILAMGPSIDQPVDLSFHTLIANTLFLQTINAPWFGTNGPLWSLANEFWYYLLFPFILGVIRGGLPNRIACGVALGVALASLPALLVQMGLIWLYGVAIAIAEEHPRVCAIAQRGLFVMASGLCVIVTLAAYKHWIWWLGNDWITGAALAIFFLSLTKDRIANPTSRAIAARLADFSYSIYLFHFPFIAFLWFCFLAPTQVAPSASGYALFGVIFACSVTYAYLMWWFFERNTNSLRRWVSGSLTMSRAKVRGSNR